MRTAILAAAVTAAFASPALAVSSVSATMSDFSVTLFDLTPGDASAPSIVWSNGPNNVDIVTINAFDSGASNEQVVWQSGIVLWDSISGSASTSLSQASTSITPGSSADPASGAVLRVSGSAQGATIAGQYSNFQATATVQGFGQPFTLSANTLALFSARAVGSVTTSVGLQPVFGDTSGDEFAEARFTLGVSSPQNSVVNGVWTQYSSGETLDIVALYTSVFNTTTNQIDYAGESKTLSGLLSGAYINSSDAPKDGNLILDVTAFGRSSVAAVPEPETYAMLLVGLGALGFIARRRRTAV